MIPLARKSFTTALAAGLVMLALTATTVADDKIRIAVVDFDTAAVRQNWRYGWSYQNLERAAADNLATQLVQTGKFRVIERQQLDQVLAEQNLGQSGRLDASSAASLGKVLGVQLIVIGSVTEFGISEVGGKARQIGKWKWGRGVGAKVRTGKSALTARLVDTTTAEILGAYEGSGTHRFGTGSFAGADLGKKWDTGMASKVLAEAVEKLAEQIGDGAGGLDPSTPRGGLEGKVARADGASIFLNIGSSSGIKPADRFEIRAVGEEILDPDTGESLGGVETTIGLVEITKIINDRLSQARVVEGEGFAAGQRAIMK